MATLDQDWGYLDFESRPVISQFGDLDENQVLVCTADVI